MDSATEVCYAAPPPVSDRGGKFYSGTVCHEEMIMRNAIGDLLLVPLLTGLAKAELQHRYSFNDGTARDTVGNADGVAVNDPK